MDCRGYSAYNLNIQETTILGEPALLGLYRLSLEKGSIKDLAEYGFRQSR